MGLQNQNSELKFRLQSMERQTQLRNGNIMSKLFILYRRVALPVGFVFELVGASQVSVCVMPLAEFLSFCFFSATIFFYRQNFPYLEKLFFSIYELVFYCKMIACSDPCLYFLVLTRQVTFCFFSFFRTHILFFCSSV